MRKLFYILGYAQIILYIGLCANYFIYWVMRKLFYVLDYAQIKLYNNHAQTILYL